MELWKHQSDAVARSKEIDNLALFFDVGTGKSATIINSLRWDYNVNKRIRRTLIMAPLSVCPQWKREFEKFSKVPQDVIHILTQDGKKRAAQMQRIVDSKRGAIIVTNYEGLQIKPFYELISKYSPEVVVLDECFSGDTHVDTPNGKVRIDQIKKGDKVMSAYGISEVLNVSKKRIKKYIVVSYGGKRIKCSRNHPFFTKNGWVAASDLREGDELITTEQAMCLLRGVVHESNTISIKTSRDLFKILHGEVKVDHTRICREYVESNDGEKSPRIVRANEEKQSYAPRKDKTESECNTKENGAQTPRERGKWAWSNSTGANDPERNTRARMELSCGYKNEGWEWVPGTLQSGLSSTEQTIGYRSGWTLPQSNCAESPRSKKRELFKTVRVESIESYEQGSDDEHEGDYFYDLEVSGHPSFSVNGCLVHNCQKIKDSSSKRAKLLYPICDKAARKFLLTGTPILNSMLDLFGQYRALDPSVFGTSFFMFRAKYFYDKNAGMSRDKHFPDWRPLPDSEKLIAEKISTTSMQAKKSECLDLPPLVKVEVPVKVSEAQAKAYEGMLKEFVAELDGAISIAEFAMTKTLRLMQILSGYLVTETDTNERNVKRFEDNPRIKATKELLESIGEEKTIIWCVFKPNYDDLQKLCTTLNKEYVMLTGEQSAAQKQEAIDKFCRGTAQIMIANPAAGGAGINLQEAKYAIYYNKNYSLEQFLQSEGRNYRGGSNMHDKITHYHLFVPHTIDEVISAALLRKQDVAETVLAWAKNINITLDTLPEDIVL